MANVTFSFDELRSELDAMSVLAKKFLSPGSDDRLKRSAAALIDLKRSRRGVWAVPVDEPISTRISDGEYDMDGRAAYRVCASMSWTWSIKPIVVRNGKAPATQFAVNGNASTKIDVYIDRNNGNLDRILAWTMDIADGSYPGAPFHVQIKNIPSGGGSEFDVPRIPCILLTPCEQLDFLLGELFQKQWLKQQSVFFAENQYARVRSLQERRTKTLLEEMTSALTRTQQMVTPWQRLKSWKPDGLKLLGAP